MSYLKLTVVLLAIVSRIWAQTPTAEPTGWISGTVYSEDGHPLAGASVFPIVPGGNTPSCATGEDGQFLLKRVPVGAVSISASKSSAGYAYTFFSFFHIPGEKIPVNVSVETDKETKGVVLTLGPRSATLRVHVTDKNGRPLTPSLSFDRDDIPGPYSTSFPPNGEMLVPPVPFKLTATEEGYENWIYVRPSDGSRYISLKSGDSLDVIVKLKKAKKN